MRSSLLIWLVVMAGATACARPPVPSASAETRSRLERVEERGALVCGVEAGVTGFVNVDANGHYSGLDVDICRAIAAAVVGSADKVRYVHTANVSDFRNDDEIDLVSRRLTWELQREGPLGILFGPVTFHDGQTFLVSPRIRARTASDLDGRDICVAGGTTLEATLTAYFDAHALTLRKVILESPHEYDAIADALASGRCMAYTGDESDLGVVRSRLPALSMFAILPAHISKEPLAPLVRDTDIALFNVMKWTIFALIDAEELGVTSANVAAMRASTDISVRRLLGVVPGNGKALGLDEAWAYRAIASVGNYGEIFERNVGAGSAINLDRGMNRLQRDGGLMYAMPLR